jgi:serine/threonine protein kinase
MPLSPGQVLNNRYRIVKLLSLGGFGAVYRAWDTNLDRPCALKENLETSTEAQRQFRREAKILADLSYPNLPRVTDYFILPGQGQYLVMDFVEGQDLQEMLEKRASPLPETKVVTWIGQVCDALTYLHSQNPPVIHRDIKPANIKITPGDKALLVDFGIAKAYDPSQKTTQGARAVTPGYSPPEQYGQGTTDARTDVYALGATLYMLLTGQPLAESILRNVGRPLIPPRSINPSISIRTEQAILQATQILPSERFQSAAAFKNALLGKLARQGNPVSRGNRATRVNPALQRSGATRVNPALQGSQVTQASPTPPTLVAPARKRSAAALVLPQKARQAQTNASTRHLLNSLTFIGVSAILLSALLVVGGILLLGYLSGAAIPLQPSPTMLSPTLTPPDPTTTNLPPTQTSVPGRPWLGITGSTLTSNWAGAMNLPTNQKGVVIVEITPGGPADKAGLHGCSGSITVGSETFQTGCDIITALNGNLVETMEFLVASLVNQKPGEAVTLTVLRGGSPLTIQAILAEWPVNIPTPMPPGFTPSPTP